MTEKPPEGPEDKKQPVESPMSPEEEQAELELARGYAREYAASLQELRRELEELERASERDEDVITQKRADIEYLEEELARFPDFISESEKPAGDFIPKKTKI